ncbi:MAG: hypothetical protein ACJAQ6_001980 [Arenicella sp.]|jgi:hypothetical protein
MIGIVFTTVMFQSGQHPDNWGRTWQDNFVIATVTIVYVTYLYKIGKEAFTKK